MDIQNYTEKYKENPALKTQQDLEQRMSVAHKTGEDMSLLSEELAYYSTLSDKIKTIQKAITSYQESQELLNDPEMRDLAQLELEKNEKDILNLDEDITKMKIDKQ